MLLNFELIVNILCKFELGLPSVKDFAVPWMYFGVCGPLGSSCLCVLIESEGAFRLLNVDRGLLVKGHLKKEGGKVTKKEIADTGLQNIPHAT